MSHERRINPVDELHRLEFERAAANVALDLIKEGRIDESFNLSMWHVLYKLTGIRRNTTVKYNGYIVEYSDSIIAPISYSSWKEDCLRSGSPPKQHT